MTLFNDLIDQLVPHAAKLLAEKGDQGATVSELRDYLQITTDSVERLGHRATSALGQVFRRAGGVNSGRKRPSIIPHQHGIYQTVWVME